MQCENEFALYGPPLILAAQDLGFAMPDWVSAFGPPLALELRNLNFAMPEWVYALRVATHSGISKLTFCDARMSLRFAIDHSFWNLKTEVLRCQNEFPPEGSPLILE